MMYLQYQRIESVAGGITCTPREFVKAAHSKLSKVGKRAEHREARHLWLREGLKYLSDAKGFVRAYRL